ncbi:MAG: cupin domain-containing protein [Pseudolabrys sp.]
MYQTIIDASTVHEQALDIDGVSIRVLHRSDTGAMAVVTQMRAGATIPAHWHSKADETVYVLSGDFIEDGVAYGPGAYFVGAARTVHGPHTTKTGCTLLTHFSAELDFNLGEVPAQAEPVNC